nr:Putative alpha-expansin [Oryza sativa Japonica Group]
MGNILLQLLAVVALCIAPARSDWLPGTATFYGGADGSGTMVTFVYKIFAKSIPFSSLKNVRAENERGGACGYGNLYDQRYGINNAALSTPLFNDGASCGQCYLIICDYGKAPDWCKLGKAITVTGTNYGGWCNATRPYFDMSQPAWENIGIYSAGIVPILYQQVKCWRYGGVRFIINGFNYFELVLVTNMAGSGSIVSMSVKGSCTGWIQMTRNWGANWQCLAGLAGQALSFNVTSTGGQTIVFDDAVPAGWSFGQTFSTYHQFDY